MNTYTVTYWTGTTTTVTADDLTSAYAALGYHENDGTYLWIETRDSATVTNQHGDVCADIVRVVSLVKDSATVDAAGWRKLAADVARTERVELLGNTSFGKIVRSSFGKASIANGTLYPLTAFTY